MFWYEEDVNRAIQELKRCSYQPETIFYGSSSIRLWHTIYKDFPNNKLVNLGFGGSTMAACVWFFERIVAQAKDPKSIIIYAGDNDLGDGRHPEEVFIFYQQLAYKIRHHFGGISCYFISIKPSIKRWHLNDQIKFTNHLIKTDIEQQNNDFHYVNIYDQMLDKNKHPDWKYFEEDGLHLNAQGYRLWKQILLTQCSFLRS